MPQDGSTGEVTTAEGSCRVRPLQSAVGGWRKREED